MHNIPSLTLAASIPRPWAKLHELGEGGRPASAKNEALLEKLVVWTQPLT